MLHRQSRALREIYRLSREAPVADFQDATFEAMKELVRFDAGYWGGGREPVEAVVVHYAHLYRLPTEEMSAAFEKVKSHPKHTEIIFRCVINAGQAQAFDTREVGVDDFYSPYGIDQVVTLYTHDDDLGLYHVISLYRSGAERFTEPERLLFESAVPHLLDAWRESKLLISPASTAMPARSPRRLRCWTRKARCISPDRLLSKSCAANGRTGAVRSCRKTCAGCRTVHLAANE